MSFVVLGLALAQPAAGKKYALLVGIDKYQHDKLPDLHYAERDVNDLASILRPAGYEVTVLTGATGENTRKPTKKTIEDSLKEVLRKCQKGDIVVLAFAGHGLQFDNQADAFFCPIDARPFKDESSTLVSLTGIYAELEKSFAGMKVLLVDACRNDPDPTRASRGGIDADFAPKPPQGVAALFSCRAGERAFEHEKLQHGVFFYHVLQGLKGEAQDKRGQVTFAGLASYVSQEVRDYVPKYIGAVRQSPNLKADYSIEPILVARDSGDAGSHNVKPTLSGKEITVDLGNGVKMEFVRIPADEFMMGAADDEEKEDDERPRHRVRITKDFYMGKYEVTRGQFRRFVDDEGFKTEAERDGLGGWGYDEAKQEFSGPTYNEDKTGLKGPGTNYSWRNTGFSQTDSHPVVNVSWNDATAYCQWLTRTKKIKAGLPTEAQWEYACRAETTTRYYSGDDPESLARIGNVSDGTAKKKFPKWTTIEAEDGYVFTSPVGQFQKNKFGLCDMHGNVWEWCQDWYDSKFYSRSSASDPLCTDGEQKFRVLRGGSWYDLPVHCRAAYRYRDGAFYRDYDVGFRVVLRLD